MKQALFFLAIVLSGYISIGQTSSLRDGEKVIWENIDESSVEKTGARHTIPVKYLVYKFNYEEIKNKLDLAPYGRENIDRGITLTFPTPAGESIQVKVANTPIFSEEQQTKTSFIQTYTGYNIDNKSELVKIDYSANGLHVMILTNTGGGIFIDPYQSGDTQNYIVYYKNNFKTDETINCLNDQLDPTLDPIKQDAPVQFDRSQGSCQLKTYELVIGATGEYTSFHGGLAGAQSAIATTMNRVNGLFERDMAITMVIISGTEVIYTNGSTDPYSNNNGGSMLSENQTVMDNTYGYANYDIGHVFSTGGGGVAYQRACASSLKAGGVTGSSSPVGDPFDVDYVAHEMGHQWGADHTFNGTSGSCGGGNRSASTAYEPGSGTTILAYAGICSPQNVQSNSDAVYHAASIVQMSSHVATYSSCGTTTNSGNSAPVANAGSNYTIPISTPFTLTGSATDADGDALTYTWEQYDLEGTSSTPPTTTDTDGPNFRCFLPQTSPSRTFPNLTDLNNNVQWPTWEVIPAVSKTMNFRFTVRDNSAGGYGCTDMDDMTVTTDASSGPFLVTYPTNTGISWAGNSSQTVTWNVAGTNTGSVSCSNVDILLSTDGGLTYSTTVISNVPNDGSQVITVPNIATTTARIKVVCSDNIFFDISNNNFTITAALFDYTLSTTSSTANICPPANATYTIDIGQIGGYSDDVTLSVSGNPAGTSTSFSTNPVTPAGSSTLTISNTASATPGTYTLTVQGNSTSGTKSINLTLSIADATPSTVTLSSPTNGATGVDVGTSFSWTASSGSGIVYDIDIATDAGFSNIVESTTDLTTTSYTATSLSTGTTYYWRVLARNGCASAPYSSTFSFTTSNCSTLLSSDVPKTITSSGTPTITSTMNVTTTGTITDLNVVDLIGTHSYIQDLTFTLTSPQGTSVVLFSNICGNVNNFDLGLDDEASSATLPCPPTDQQSYQPQGSLSSFDGEDPSGTWTLTINDGWDQDGGQLTSWGIELCVTLPSNCSVTSTVNNNVTCNGDSDGSATINPTNGTTPYSYIWSNGGNKQTENTLAAGTYTVTVSDAGGCSQTTSLTITQPSAIVISEVSTSISCNGGNDGSIDLTASGGTGTLTYLWSNGTTTQDISNLIADRYTVTITDGNLCESGTSIELFEPNALSITITHTDELCGNGNGTAIASASGGDGSYSYSWDTGSNSASINSLSANRYTVTVTDGNNCTASQSVDILDISGPTAGTSSVNAICNTNGSASVSVTGGTGPYNYSWSSGGNGTVETGLSSGSYTVTVSDDNNCKDIQSVSVGNTVNIITSSINTADEICGNSNGSVTITPSGGTTPYSYVWSNGTTTNPNTGLSANTYNVTITDINSCSANESVTISNTVSSVSATLSTTDDYCSNGVGTVSAVGTNGSSPYSYVWSNGGNNATETGLNNGTYFVTVTDNNNCDYISSVTVNATTPSTIVTSTVTDASCGASTGAIDITASGGASPYSYSWSNASTTQNISSLNAGNYTVTVTDNNNCVVSETIAVSNLSGMTTNASGTNETCSASNGSASVTVTGGTTPYNYLWTDSETTATITGLSAGTYTVTVTDGSSCLSIRNVVLTNSIHSVSSSSSDAHCSLSDGSATAVVSSGLTPYSYLWDDGSSQTTSTASNLVANTYNVTVTDGNNCELVASVTINDIAGPSLSISGTNENCGMANGSATTTVTGGSAPYTYSWSSGATTTNISNLSANTYSVTVSDLYTCTQTASITISNIGGPNLSVTSTDANCGSNDGTATVNVTGGTTPYSYLWNDSGNQNTSTATGLSANTYVVTVTDGGGCSSQTNVTVSSSGTKKYTVDITTPNCNGPNVTWEILDGSSTVIASGSMGRGETKTWDVCDCGETFVLTAPAQTSGNPSTRCPDNIAPQAANIYDDTGALIGSTDTDGGTVSLIGYSGCSYTCPAITVNTTATDISCNSLTDGILTATASGGNTPYTYVWSNSVTAQSISGLAANTYTVTATDVNGCSGNSSGTITEPLALTVNVVNTSVSCFSGNDGTATSSVLGGTSPYNYLWSDGSNNSTATNLTAGNYTITVADNNNCETTQTTIVVEPSQITITSTVTDAICMGNNGSVSITASGGYGPYNYNWSSGGNTATESGLTSANYTITVTDNNLCNETANVSVGNQNITLTLTDAVTNDFCGLSNGSVTITTSGGTTPYSYIWSSGGFANIETGLNQGNHTVTVTDNNGCSSQLTSSVGNDNGQSVTVSTVSSTCGNANGSASLVVSGGTTPYTYNWSTGGTSVSENNIVAGNHSVTVTDNTGCAVVENYTLNNIAGANVAISTTDATCGSANGEAQAIITGGTTPFTYNWSAGSATDTQTGLGAGNIRVTVTDGNSCETTVSDYVNNVFPTIVSVTSADETCTAANGSASIAVSGGTTPYIYNWNTGNTTDTDNGLSAGTYAVTVNDAANCLVFESFTITDSPAPVLATSVVDAACNQVNGSASVYITSGGTSPYSYLWSTGGAFSTENPLSANTYFVTVTDNNNCKTVASAIINNISGPVAAVTTTQTACNTNDGTATVSASGGTTPYSYSWSSGGGGTVAGGLSAGTYYVTVTDQNNCKTTQTALITQVDSPSITLTASDAHCGNADGNTSVTIGGGNPGYSVLWSNAVNTSNNNNVVAGNYMVTVTDSKGCKATGSTTVNDIAGPTLSLTATAATCGLNNGSVSSSVSGGTGPYTYSWNNSATTANIASLSTGNYALTVQDNQSCITSAAVFVGNDVPSINITTTDETCGGANGTATVVPSSGQTPYTYLWNDGNINDYRNNLTNGAYAVTVTDGSSCVTVESITIGDSGGAITVTTSDMNETCGRSDGIGSVSAVGGTAPYAYLWSNGYTTATQTGMTSGNYYVTVSDINNCESIQLIKIGHTDGPSSIISHSDATCNLANAAIDVVASSGTTPYSYLWSNGNNNSSQTNIPAGNYTVTITDNNGCTDVNSETINDSGVPTVSIVTNSASCGNTNGDATASPSGGQAPYGYLWPSGGTNAFESGLGAGNHIVTVTDANSCSVTGIASIGNTGGPSVNETITNATCGNSNGSVSLAVTGGTTPYTYLWNNGSNSSSISNQGTGSVQVTVTDNNSCIAVGSFNISNSQTPVVNVTTSFATCSQANGSAEAIVGGGTTPYSYVWNNGATTQLQSGVAAGTYTVSVTDNNGCTAAASGFVNNNIPTITTNSTNASCGKSDGNALVAVSGGVIPYSYNWSSGGNNSIETNLATGLYTVTVGDASGCVSIQNISVGEISGPSVSHSFIEASCGVANGSATAIATGGQSPYYYLWTSGGNQATESGLAAGSYQLIVTDDNGCSETENIVITNAGAPVLTVSTTNSNCGNNDGSATVSISGGQSPYSVQWNSGSTTTSAPGLSAGTYTATVIDDNSCITIKSITISDNSLPTLILAASDENCSETNGSIAASLSFGSANSYLWSNGATTSSITGLNADLYSVTVTESNGCTIISQTSITDIPAPILNITASDALCGSSTGDISIDISSGTSPYTFSWSNSSTTLSQTGLLSGTYTVTVNDANCSVTASITVSASEIPSTTITANNETCTSGNGSAFVTVTSGTSPYSYSWSNGSLTANASNLNAGMIYVTVTDFSGCYSVDSTSIGNIQPEMSVSVTNETCNQENGDIRVSVINGQPPYTYDWSNGDNGAIIQQLDPGNYLLTVTDANNCVITNSINVGSDGGPVLSINGTDASCGEDNGVATAVVSGGVTPYNYNWNNGATSKSISALSAGIYSLFLTDASSCITSASIELDQSEGPTVELAVEPSSCDENNGEISVFRSGGTPPITYTWSNGDNSFFIENLAEGEYILTVTDANNCSVIDTATVENTNEICISIPTGFTPNGDGVNDVWNISGYNYYSDINVEVYNRWGTLLFSSQGYSTPWDGTYNGNDLPSAVYYFIITVPSEDFSQTGTITIRR